MSIVTTHIMFQGQAQDALDLYQSVFDDFEITNINHYDDGLVQTAYIDFNGHQVLVIDSPTPHKFDLTPSMSLFVDFETEDEQQDAHDQLADGGEIMMPLDNYGFSRRFAWVKDRFGMSWQLNLPE